MLRLTHTAIQETLSQLCKQPVQTSLLKQSAKELVLLQAKTYKNKALSALFLMNNVHYMVKAVESSPALAVIGEDWIELHRDQACSVSSWP